MQSKYGKDGLVVLTVSIDPTTDKLTPELEKKVLEKAVKHKLAMTNLILDEPVEVIHKRLRFGAPPCVYLFDRAGKWHLFDPPKKNKDTGGYDELEEMVKKLVAGK